jgi:hypothetical protein
MKQVASFVSCSFFAGLILLSWRWRRHMPPKCLLNVDGLHAVVSQKIGHFLWGLQILRIFVCKSGCSRFVSETFYWSIPTFRPGLSSDCDWELNHPGSETLKDNTVIPRLLMSAHLNLGTMCRQVLAFTLGEGSLDTHCIKGSRGCSGHDNEEVLRSCSGNLTSTFYIRVSHLATIPYLLICTIGSV